MKGYNTTLSCWVPGEGRLILLCPEWVRFLLLPVKTIVARLLHHCYPCSTAALQCHQFTAGLVTTLSITWSISTSFLTYWWVRILGWRIVIMAVICCRRLLLHAHCCKRAAVMSNYCWCIYYSWHDLTATKWSLKGREFKLSILDLKDFQMKNLRMWKLSFIDIVATNQSSKMCVYLLYTLLPYTLHSDPILMKKTLDSCCLLS